MGDGAPESLGPHPSAHDELLQEWTEWLSRHLPVDRARQLAATTYNTFHQVTAAITGGPIGHFAWISGVKVNGRSQSTYAMIDTGGSTSMMARSHATRVG
jgi:predicted aspartyl protease